MFEYEDGAKPTFPEDSDSDEDEESSLQGDYGDSTEDEEPAPPRKPPVGNELEWDHASFWRSRRTAQLWLVLHVVGSAVMASVTGDSSIPSPLFNLSAQA